MSDEVKESGPPPKAPPVGSEKLSEAGQSSMRNELEAARAQQAELDAEMKADAAALKTKFAPHDVPAPAEQQADGSETGAPPDVPPPGGGRPGDAGRNSMQGALDAARAEQAQLEAEMKADAAALDTKFGPKPVLAKEENKEAISEWVDRGIQDVPVADLPQPDGITVENFDHHITHQDAVRALEKFEKMRPLLAQGYKSEDFAALDRANGLEYADGQQRIHDLFFGSDPVYVNKDGANYDIISGRHRVFVAKELGIETIPARVKERVHR